MSTVSTTLRWLSLYKYFGFLKRAKSTGRKASELMRAAYHEKEVQFNPIKDNQRPTAIVETVRARERERERKTDPYTSTYMCFITNINYVTVFSDLIKCIVWQKRLARQFYFFFASKIFFFIKCCFEHGFFNLLVDSHLDFLNHFFYFSHFYWRFFYQLKII